MTAITETRHAGGFLVSESKPGLRSRDQVTLVQQAAITTPPVNQTQAGTVLGQITVGATAAYAAAGGNTGNFTCGAVTVTAGAVEGAYTVVFASAAAFGVYLPGGVLLAEGHVGTAFGQGGIGFTLTAGVTPAVAGDQATITLAAAANSGLYTPLSLTAADGSQNAAAILFNTIDATRGNTAVTVISRAAEVNGGELVYPAGATLTQIAAINAQLAAAGIIVR